MGYGHQRAVFPLAQLSDEAILTVGSTAETSLKEKSFWHFTLKAYEMLSRINSLPLVGPKLFKMLDFLLAIPPLYPQKDHSAQSFQTVILKKFIQSGLCRSVMNAISAEKKVLVTSFYATAVAAEYFGVEEIFCIICDADLNRVWVSAKPSESRIKYLVPCGRAEQRLLSYGVPGENIFVTGFPLPFNLLGNRELDVLRKNLSIRLKKLDPNSRFRSLYSGGIKKFLGDAAESCSNRLLTVTFCVGGAGAQKELAHKIACSLENKLHHGKIRLILVAGWRKEVFDYFVKIKQSIMAADSAIEIIYSADRSEYFNHFNQILAETDILWTKPSELSFYCALGIPIILSPSIGAQERCNKSWLTGIGAAIKQDNPDFTDQWLFDLINSGRLAEAAWSGFLKGRKMGSYRIVDVLNGIGLSDEYHPLVR